MRERHHPTDASAADPPAPAAVTDAVSAALGRRVRLFTHPWHVTRKIHIGDGVVVRDATDSAAARAATARELAAAVRLGPAIAQQPLLGEPLVVNSRLLTVWEHLVGRTGRNLAGQALQLAALAGVLHREIPIDGAPPAADPLAKVAARLPLVRSHRDEVAHHHRCASRALDRLGAPSVQAVVHGDLHGGNAVFTDDTVRLIDLEGVGVGDPHWDLAVLARSHRRALGSDSAAAVAAAYGAPVDVVRVRVLGYVRAASTLPVKLTAEGLVGFDFAADVADANAEHDRLVADGAVVCAL